MNSRILPTPAGDVIVIDQIPIINIPDRAKEIAINSDGTIVAFDSWSFWSEKRWNTYDNDTESRKSQVIACLPNPVNKEQAKKFKWLKFETGKDLGVYEDEN